MALFYVLSAELSCLSPEANALRTESLRESLKAHGFFFIPARGVYDGSEEQSFIVMPDTASQVDAVGTAVRTAMRRYGQDSILEVQDDGAVLEYNSGERLPIGQWQRHSGSVAGLMAYTKVGDFTFVCK